MFQIKPYGPNAVLISFPGGINPKTHRTVKKVYQYFQKQATNGITAVIPAYDSLTVMYLHQKVNPDLISEMTAEALLSNYDQIPARILKIPVCYADKHALDKIDFMQATQLNWDDIVQLHTQPQYLVYMMGFVPGFMYLGGLNHKLKVSRKSVPRLKVAKGSVGIANEQTGVYPFEIPGGWQIIGRTAVDLMPQLKGIAVEMGDSIQFVPVTEKQFTKPNQTIKIVQP